MVVDDEKLKKLENLRELLPYDCMGDLSVYLKEKTEEQQEIENVERRDKQ